MSRMIGEKSYALRKLLVLTLASGILCTAGTALAADPAAAAGYPELVTHAQRADEEPEAWVSAVLVVDGVSSSVMKHAASGMPV